MGHQDQHSTVRGHDTGQAAHGAVGILRIGFRGLAARIDVLQRDSAACGQLREVPIHVELGTTFAMGNGHRQQRARHASEPGRAHIVDARLYRTCLEPLRAIADEARPAFGTRYENLEFREHLTPVADAERQCIAGEEPGEGVAQARLEQDRLRPAATPAEHVTVGEAPARGQRLEAGKLLRIREEVRHVHVDSLETGAIERRGHLDLAVDALLAQDRNTRP